MLDELIIIYNTPTWDCTNFIKIGFKEKENCQKKVKFYAYKKI